MTVQQDRPNSNAADLDEIRRAIKLLLAPGQLTELRCLQDRGQDVGGFYDDQELLAAHVATSQCQTAIFIPNPIKASLLERSPNCLGTIGICDTTTDYDIVRRHWLRIICDPIRPSNVHANDAERELALQKSEDVESYLTSLGWPEAIRIDSGSSVHLVYRVNLPKETCGLDAGCLDALSRRFTDHLVKISTLADNASKMWILPGTFVQQGLCTTERPRRMVMVISAPCESFIDVPVVDLDQLKALAKERFNGASIKGPERAPSDASAGNLVGHRQDAQEPPAQRQGAEADVNNVGDPDRRLKTNGTTSYLDLQRSHAQAFRKEGDVLSLASILRPERLSVGLPDVLADWRSRFETETAPARFPTGLPFAWGPGQLLLIGAGPGVGKTTLAVQAVTQALLADDSLRALVVNVEMPASDLVERQLAIHSGIAASRIRYHEDMPPAERERLDEACRDLAERIGDRLQFMTEGSLGRIRQAAKEHNANVLVVDYLQRMKPDGKPTDKRMAVENTLADLRRMCFEGMGVLAISSLSRPQTKGDGYAKADITSFKESSEIEYGADEAYVMTREAKTVRLKAVKLRHRSLDEGNICLRQDDTLRFTVVNYGSDMEGR